MTPKIINKIIQRFFRFKQNLLKWKNWENINFDKWERYASPFRPSLDDIANYERILEKIGKKKKILILGSTPELRDIAAKLNADVIAADFSQNMLKGMLRFAKNVIASKERRIVADWLSLNKFFKNDYFDVILGDLVLRNIEPEMQEKFLYKISGLLNPDGFFVSRVHFVNESLLNFSSNCIIIDTLDEYLDLENKFFEELITSRLFDKYTDFKQHNINKISFLESIKKYLKLFCRNKREKLILNNVLQKWGGEITWTQRTKKEIDVLLTKSFIIENIKLARDYKDSDFYPVYALKKRVENL